MAGNRFRATEWAWVFALIGGGVVLLLIAVVLQPTVRLSILPNLLGQLGALMIATGVLGVGFDLFGKQNLARDVVSDYELVAAAKSAGVEGLCVTGTRASLSKLPEVTSAVAGPFGGEIRILVATDSHVETDLREQLADAAAAGTKITVLLPAAIPDGDYIKRTLRKEIAADGMLDVVDVEGDGTLFAMQSLSQAVLAQSSNRSGGPPYLVLAGGVGQDGESKFYTHVSELISGVVEVTATVAAKTGAASATGGDVVAIASGQPLTAAEIDLMTGRGRRAADVRPLQPLVAKGWVDRGAVLTWKYKQQPWEATVQEDGSLVLRDGTDLKTFKNPSAAANWIIDSGQVSGWEAWKYDGVPLRVVRERAIAASE